ncbi:hypothetical protein GGI20_005039, partial [Coemansia sp. BCRC 34301]
MPDELCARIAEFMADSTPLSDMSVISAQEHLWQLGRMSEIQLAVSRGPTGPEFYKLPTDPAPLVNSPANVMS